MPRQQMESLEVRALMSATLDNGNLVITGTEQADDIIVQPFGSRHVVVNVNGDETFFRTFFVNKITVNALGGDDRVELQVARQSFISGGAGIDTLIGGSGSDTIDGDQGNDQVFGNKGNDTLVWDPGDGSDFFEGGKGFDNFLFNGSDGAEVMAATANGNRVTFTRNLGNIVMDVGSAEKMTVIAKGGADQITVNNLAGTSIQQVVIDAGAGDDVLNGGNLAEILLGGEGNDTIDGNQGNDSMLGDAGDDLLIWDPGDGSDLVVGGVGNDRLLFNGSNGDEVFTATAVAKFNRTIFTRDLGNIVMDVRSTETLDLEAKGGADTVTINDQTVSAVRTVNVDLESATDSNTPDDKADEVTVTGTRFADTITAAGPAAGPAAITGLSATVNVKGASADLDELTIDGLAGNDTIDAAAVAAGTFRVVNLYGGLGNDSVKGSAGVDIMSGAEGNDLLDGQQGNDSAWLGSGDDTFVWDPGDGSDLVEGQKGTDTLRFNGSGGAENMTVTPNGARFTFFRNLGNITMDMGTTEKVDVFAAGGDDTILVGNLVGTGLASVFADGGEGNDTLDLRNDAGVAVTNQNVENVLQ
ncbi:MAG TPA: calcium-binding protein [Tepidisphaeraceae bacterium]|nr:calcium-binding protein [Tepidisphaeraceae bacterium]